MARPKRYETAAQKQKAYRERKKLSGRGMVNSALAQTGSSRPVSDETKSVTTRDHSPVEDGGDHQMQVRVLPARSTIEELRELIKPENLPRVEATMPATKPKVFFNDYGAQISEKLWNELQEKKRIAREAGYEFDPQ